MMEIDYYLPRFPFTDKAGRTWSVCMDVATVNRLFSYAQALYASKHPSSTPLPETPWLMHNFLLCWPRESPDLRSWQVAIAIAHQLEDHGISRERFVAECMSDRMTYLSGGVALARACNSRFCPPTKRYFEWFRESYGREI